MNILITGGTGLIGSRLTHFLLEKGHAVAYLSRKKQAIENVKVFEWDIAEQYIETGALAWADVIAHLAGTGIADERWTENRKREIIVSRVKPSQLLLEKLKGENKSLEAFVSASAIGFYGGDTGEIHSDETSTSGKDFLAKCTLQWEDAAEKLANECSSRLVKIRVGVVFSAEGGALPKLLQPTQWGVGAALGTGKQWMSWIHIDDLCRIFLKAIEDKTMQGVYNGVAPSPVRNEELTKKIAKTLHRPLWLPNVPSFALKMLLGEMSVVVLGGSYVENTRIPHDFFAFKTIDDALKNLL